MKQKTDIQRAFITVLVLVVTLTGCGASSDSTISTEISLAEIPLCTVLESHLEYYSEYPAGRILPEDVERFRIEALLPSGPEKQIAEWFCEMSERFPGQMSFTEASGIHKPRPLASGWGLRFLAAQFGIGRHYYPRAIDASGKVEKPWGNPNTYADDVFPGCEPGLGLRTQAYPAGILREFPSSVNVLAEEVEFTNTVAPGAIRALNNGTFNEYQRASKEEWVLTFASDLLYPPTRQDPPNGTTQVGYLMERFEARLIDAGNLLYIKVACPEIWAQLNAGGEGEPESYLDYLSAGLTQPALKQSILAGSWPTHRGVQWYELYEQEIYKMTGCNFERLAFASTLRTDDPEQQGYLGFECGLNPDAASVTVSFRKKFAGPSFVYVYNDPASRDVAIQRKKASDYNFEYSVAYCGEIDFGPFLVPYVAYFESADVLEKWQVWFWTSAESGQGYRVEQIPEQIKSAANFRQC